MEGLGKCITPIVGVMIECVGTDGKGWGVFLHLPFIGQLLLFLMIAMLTGERWNGNVDLIYTSLMSKEVDYLCMY